MNYLNNLGSAIGDRLRGVTNDNTQIEDAMGELLAFHETNGLPIKTDDIHFLWRIIAGTSRADLVERLLALDYWAD